MGIMEALARKEKVDVQAGAFTLALAGLPLGAVLLILLPAFFITLGVGVYVVFSMLPFILTILVFAFCYWLGTRIGMPENHKLLVSFTIALMSLLMPMIQGLSDLSLAMAQAQTDEIITIRLTVWSLIAGAMFISIVALGTYFKKKTGSWSSLVMALTGFFGSLMMGGGAMTAGLVAEPQAGSQFIGAIITLLFGGIIVGAVISALIAILVPIIAFAIMWWVIGLAVKDEKSKMVVRLVFGLILLFPLYRGVIGLADVASMAGESGLPPMPVMIIPLALILAVMILYAVRMKWIEKYR